MSTRRRRGGVLVGAGFGIPAVMGSGMLVLGYPNGEVFLAIGLVGWLVAGALAGVGALRT
ncbi:MAG TPA: hypothetical protein ACFCU0_04455 [Longibacter sp.]